MSTPAETEAALGLLSEHIREHVANVAGNLQLIADLGYADTALAIMLDAGLLSVVSDARPSTANYPFGSSRSGRLLAHETEPEAYASLRGAKVVEGAVRREARGFPSVTAAYPIGSPIPYAVVLRTFGEDVRLTSDPVHRASIHCAEGLLALLRTDVLVDAHDGQPFVGKLGPGTGVIHISRKGHIAYASANAISIMRLADVDGRIVGTRASTLPGVALGVLPIPESGRASSTEIEVSGRVLRYGCIVLPWQILLLVDDLTESRHHEQELRVQQTILKEVHHRVMNNLQEVASMLRIQARCAQNLEVQRALAKAEERTTSMAAVHRLLARSDGGVLDLGPLTKELVELIRESVEDDESRVTVTVSGDAGLLDGRRAMSLALALAELVHNALEHAFAPGVAGCVDVAFTRSDCELVVSVDDDGRWLDQGRKSGAGGSGGLGLMIVRTLVQDDLHGSVGLSVSEGTHVTMRVPVLDGSQGGAARD